MNPFTFIGADPLDMAPELMPRRDLQSFEPISPIEFDGRHRVIYYDEADTIPDMVFEIARRPDFPSFEPIRRKTGLIRDDLAAPAFKSKRVKATRRRKKLERKARRALR